jgi:hypothetical protein
MALPIHVYGVCTHGPCYLGLVSVQSYTSADGLCRAISSLAGVVDPNMMAFIAPEHLENAIGGSSLAELIRIDAKDFVQQLMARKAEFATEQGMEIETPNATGVSIGVFVGPLLCSQHGSLSHQEAADPAPALAQQAAASGEETAVDKVGVVICNRACVHVCSQSQPV